MKQGYNRSTVMGNLSENPDVRRSASGLMLGRIVVETPRSWKDREGNLRSESDFVPCLLKGKDAENAEIYLKKGSAVLVEGHLTTRTFEDQNGNHKSVTEVMASKVLYLGGVGIGGESIRR
jgi:single-strand DNA-binding protein